MALPVLNTSKYEMEIPSSGEKVEYRPFLVKEQKVLMIAQESGNQKELVNTIFEVIKTCTFGKVDKPESLPTFDLEYMFLMIRSKSVGSEIKVNLLCPDDNETRVETMINVDDVNVVRTEGHTNEIMLTDDIGVVMSYPTMGMVSGFGEDGANVTKMTFDVLEKSIKSVFDKEQVYDDMNKKDLTEFIESMNTEQFDKLQKFFDSMPRLKHTVMVKNPNTGVESEVVIEGLQSFLG